MPTANQIKKQIDSIIRHLVEVGLASDQNFAVQRDTDGHVEITFPQARHVSVAMKDLAYAQIYQHLASEQAYSVRMPDGALIQMMYLFEGKDKDVERHRLAFFPAPHLEEFQNNPEIYLEDAIYADVIAKNIVPFPLRFDYDANKHQEVNHAKSHLTLGQYEHCRIPVSAPLTPFWFIDFILRNFYHTAFLKYADQLPKLSDVFEDSIAPLERRVVHVQIPFGRQQ